MHSQSAGQSVCPSKRADFCDRGFMPESAKNPLEEAFRVALYLNNKYELDGGEWEDFLFHQRENI